MTSRVFPSASWSSKKWQRAIKRNECTSKTALPLPMTSPLIAKRRQTTWLISQVPMVTNINLLLTISIQCQEIRLWELQKWSPKRNCLYLLSNSLTSFFKEMYGVQFGEFVRGYWGLKEILSAIQYRRYHECKMVHQVRCKLRLLADTPWWRKPTSYHR